MLMLLLSLRTWICLDSDRDANEFETLISLSVSLCETFAFNIKEILSRSYKLDALASDSQSVQGSVHIFW